MGITNYDKINAETANAKVLATEPSTPMAYYGFTSRQDAGLTEWVGGEMYYNSTDGKLYVQTATSGASTGTWVGTSDAFVTSTTTTTSSTSSSTSSTTSSTSTSTSTSSSTSTSTSTSSTTTLP